MIIALSFVLLLAGGVPIAFVMGGVGLIGLLLHPDGLLLLPSLTEQIFNQLNSFPFLTIPLFIFAGAIMSEGGIAARLMDVANMTVGRGRGGLGSAIVVASLFFHGISGSSSADTAAIGKVTLPGLRRQGYPPQFAAALLASAGATSTLIPPSTDFILIGVVANMSIAGLFAAGLIPACVNALGLILLVIYTAYKNGYGTEHEAFDPKAVAWAVFKAIPGLFMIVIIIGGILGGVFTPTEASSVAVVYGIFLTVFVYRSLTIKRLVTMFRETIEIAGMVLTVIAMSAVLSYTLTIYQVPTALAASLDSFTHSKILFLLLVQILFRDRHRRGHHAGAADPDADPDADGRRARGPADSLRDTGRNQHRIGHGASARWKLPVHRLRDRESAARAGHKAAAAVSRRAYRHNDDYHLCRGFLDVLAALAGGRKLSRHRTDVATWPTAAALAAARCIRSRQ